MRIFSTAIAATLFAAAPAMAQNNDQGGLVNVAIQDVSILNNFLNESQIAALSNLAVPVTVQVPVGVAANVCGVSANVIARQTNRSDYTCNAQSGSEALAQNVIRQRLTQTR